MCVLVLGIAMLLRVVGPHRTRGFKCAKGLGVAVGVCLAVWQP